MMKWVTAVPIGIILSLAFGPVGVALSQNKDADSLAQVYKKEFVFLENERRFLEQRLSEIERQARERVSAQEEALLALEREKTARAIEVQELQERLGKLDDRSATVDGGQELVEAMLFQAQSSLNPHGVQVQGELPIPEKVDFLLERAIEVIDIASGVSVESGPFFLADGEKVAGRIARIGQIAAFGNAEGRGGALVPAGGNHLKVWTDPSGRTLPRLVEQRHAPTLELYVYESLQDAVDTQAAKTWLESVQAGGPIGWVIVGLGAFTGLVIIARTVLLIMASAGQRTATERVRPSLLSGNVEEAIDRLEGPGGSIVRVLRVTLKSLRGSRTEADDIISERILQESLHVDRLSTLIFVAGAVAPLLGLLGTVTGMIATFDVITEVGTDDPKLLSAGISEALVTTMLGLIVAIPALFFGNLLARWAETLKGQMERSALVVLSLYDQGVRERGQ